MSGLIAGLAALLAVPLLARCAGPPEAAEGPLPVLAGTASGVKAVLIAGDASIPVFDDATASMGRWLRSRGAPEANIVRLSASAGVIAREGARPATLHAVLTAIGGMAPPPGGSCLVFATSHGGHGGVGLYLAASGGFLPPPALQWAVERGCGAAPAVIVVSACYSGVYARPPLAAPNHIVLTAARADRSSFGCAAGREYTVYDACLLRALDGARRWRGVSASVRGCIAAEERRLHAAPPSEPQAYFGAAVGDLPVP